MPSFTAGNRIYSWGESTDGILLDQLLLFFKFKSISDLSFIPEYSEFMAEKNRITNVVESFYNFPICYEIDSPWTLVTDQIVEQHNQAGEAFYRAALDHVRTFVDEKDFNLIEDFFDTKFPKKILSNVEHYKINFKGFDTSISLKFAENYRFKSEHGYLNLFNAPKSERIHVKPIGKGDVIFMADFRQFEFRSFLNVQGITKYFNGKNLYEEIGKELNIDAQDLKVSIIAYLYGSRTNELEKFFKKNELIKKLNNCFWFNGFPVYNPPNAEPNKKIHTTIQSISQYNYLLKLEEIFELLKGKKTKFIFPLHDAMIFSLSGDEIDLIENIVSILEDDVYKVKCYVGTNLFEIEEI